MERSSCIVCQRSNLNIIEEFTDYPISPNNTSDDSSFDKTSDFTILGCSDCGCAQLRTLLDLEIIYNSTYSMTTFSKFLLDHDTFFSKFILQNTDSTDFIEVGAIQCQLLKKISEKRKVNYTILDLFPYANLPENVSFLQGNCETTEYPSDKTLILSNVFEHLYNPHRFLAQVQKNSVKEIFISIPDFDSQLRSKNVNLINRQHIFYCGINHINYLFSLYNYKCEAYYNHDNQSCMFKYLYQPNYYTLNFPLLDNISTDISNMFSDYKSKISQIDFSKSIFICPAGIYGQKLYLYLKENKKSVVGFLDNNPKKHGTRLYGTDKIVYSPSSLLSYNPESCLIILCESPYRSEIRQGLMGYNIKINDI